MVSGTGWFLVKLQQIKLLDIGYFPSATQRLVELVK